MDWINCADSTNVHEYIDSALHIYIVNNLSWLKYQINRVKEGIKLLSVREFRNKANELA